jgi:hypothetical protein
VFKKKKVLLISKVLSLVTLHRRSYEGIDLWGFVFLKGLGPANFGVDLKGAKAIASLELIPRGKSSYNLLVSDTSGRLSVHLKNASLIASHQLEPNWGGAIAQIGQTFSNVSALVYFTMSNHVKSLYRGPF